MSLFDDVGDLFRQLRDNQLAAFQPRITDEERARWYASIRPVWRTTRITGKPEPPEWTPLGEWDRSWGSGREFS